MLQLIHSGLVDVCYHQIYVVSPDCEPVLLETAFDGQSNGLCGARVDGGLLLLCGLHSGQVELEVSMHATEPPIESAWSEVVEAPFRYLSSPVRLETWEGDLICALPVDGPGYVVRWSSRRFGEADESGFVDGVDPHESYSLQIWRSDSCIERVVRQASDKAAYWHQYALGLGSK